MYKKINVIDMILFIVIVTSLMFICILYPYALVNKNVYYMIYSVISIYILCIAYSMRNLKQRIELLLFGSSLFLFQVSRSFVRLINNKTIELYFNDSMVYRQLNTVFIAYLGILIGYFIFRNKKNNIIVNKNILQNQKYLNSAKLLYYISLPCSYLVLLSKILYVMQNGYLEYYKGYSVDITSNMPYIITKISDFYFISFIIILALLPKIKSIKIELVLFIIHSSLSLFMGQRNGFILTIIFLVWYFTYRDKLNIDIKPFLTLRKIIILFCLGILLVPLSIFIADMRNGEHNKVSENRVVSLFEELGSSNHVLLRTYSIEEDIMESDKFKFILNPLRTFLNNNLLSQVIFKTKVYKPQTVEYALNTYNYAAYHTYICDPWTYLAGGGFGSSYLAESYLALGLIGVFIMSAIYIIYIKAAAIIKLSNWILRVILFTSIYWIFFSPRDLALHFLSQGINITNLIGIVFVYILGNLLNKSYKYNE